MESCEELSLVREDRDGHTACAPVVVPTAELGSDVWPGEPLKASKREAPLKMSSPEPKGSEGTWKMTRSIGGMWTRGNAWSRAVLINRA